MSPGSPESVKNILNCTVSWVQQSLFLLGPRRRRATIYLLTTIVVFGWLGFRLFALSEHTNLIRQVPFAHRYFGPIPMLVCLLVVCVFLVRLAKGLFPIRGFVYLSLVILAGETGLSLDWLSVIFTRWMAMGLVVFLGFRMLHRTGVSSSVFGAATVISCAGPIALIVVEWLTTGATRVVSSSVVPFLRPLLLFRAESVVSYFRNVSREQSWAILLFPAHFISPVPFSIREFQVARGIKNIFISRLSGLIHILFGLAAFVAACFGLRLVQSLEQVGELSTLGGLWRGWVKYMLYYFLSVGAISVPIGCANWMDIRLPRPFRFPLLSSSPVDRWRDWNVYYQRWFFQFGFVPVFRRTGSIFLGTAAAFLISFLTHENLRLLWFFLEPSSFAAGRTNQHLMFMAGHAVVVYLTFVVKPVFRSIFDGERRLGWVGVFVTHLLMAWLHQFAP